MSISAKTMREPIEVTNGLCMGILISLYQSIQIESDMNDSKLYPQYANSRKSSLWFINETRKISPIVYS